jgi:hypothetical protein
MKTAHYLLALIAGALVLNGCKRTEPTPRQIFPSDYTLAYEEIYGHCYDSIAQAVVALDLYSEGITLSKDHTIQGTGYNLYLSDVFVPDSLLEEGTYHSASTGEPFTFLPGQDFEGYPNGMYILHIENNLVTSIQVLDSGSFVYSGDSLRFTLYYRNAEGITQTYQPRFEGTLIPWPKH